MYPSAFLKGPVLLWCSPLHFQKNHVEMCLPLLSAGRKISLRIIHFCRCRPHFFYLLCGYAFFLPCSFQSSGFNVGKHTLATDFACRKKWDAGVRFVQQRTSASVRASSFRRKFFRCTKWFRNLSNRRYNTFCLFSACDWCGKVLRFRMIITVAVAIRLRISQRIEIKPPRVCHVPRQPTMNTACKGPWYNYRLPANVRPVPHFKFRLKLCFVFEQAIAFIIRFLFSECKQQAFDWRV